MIPPIIDVAGVLVSSDIITERFCCDVEQCKGACCVEGDAGAPVTLDEIGEIEDALDVVWEDMTASAQAVVDRQGVAYTDREGELVTSIVGGKDCVFTYYDDLEITNTQHPSPITQLRRPLPYADLLQGQEREIPRDSMLRRGLRRQYVGSNKGNCLKGI